MHVTSHLLVAALVFQTFNFALAQEAQVPEPAPSGAYVSDQPHTSLTWKVSHFGLSNFTARFVGIDAQLGWNAEDPSLSTLTVAVDPRSVRTDFPFPEQEDFDAKIGTIPLSWRTSRSPSAPLNSKSSTPPPARSVET